MFVYQRLVFLCLFSVTVNRPFRWFLSGAQTWDGHRFQGLVVIFQVIKSGFLPLKWASRNPLVCHHFPITKTHPLSIGSISSCLKSCLSVKSAYRITGRNLWSMFLSVEKGRDRGGAIGGAPRAAFLGDIWWFQAANLVISISKNHPQPWMGSQM